jgi:hypothetical protein
MKPMKKSYNFLLLFSVAVMLLTSCSEGSKLALTKRHYRNGYYVDRGNSKTTQTVIAENKSINHKEVKQSETANSSASSSDVPEQIQTVPADKPASVKEHASVRPAVAHSHSSVRKTAEAPSTAKSFASQATSKLKSAPSVVNPFFVAKKIGQKLSAPVDGDDGARSLIWLIIVIILILWLLGLLFSFGGDLIHLLLVVALILFILWLLRII